MNNICKFCGKEKKLIKAHIIPRHFFLNYKNERFVTINANTGNWKQCKNGPYDKNILCSDCDNNIFGKFDSEAYRILLNECIDNFFETKYNQDILYHLTEKDFNYIFFRNFFISVLWRASVSNMEEFANINLGIYENIALQIMKNQITDDRLFKILILKNPKGLNNNAIVYLSKVKAMHETYCLSMAGYFILIFTNERNIPLEYINYYGKFFLEKGNLYILESPLYYKKHCQHIYGLRESCKKLSIYLQKQYDRLGQI